MKRSKNELMEMLKVRIGEDTSDEALTIIEDFNDSFPDMEDAGAADSEWERKYTELDDTWRKRYKERFFNPTAEVVEDNKVDLIEESSPKDYDDLFTEREG